MLKKHFIYLLILIFGLSGTIGTSNLSAKSQSKISKEIKKKHKKNKSKRTKRKLRKQKRKDKAKKLRKQKRKLRKQRKLRKERQKRRLKKLKQRKLRKIRKQRHNRKNRRHRRPNRNKIKKQSFGLLNKYLPDYKTNDTVFTKLDFRNENAFFFDLDNRKSLIKNINFWVGTPYLWGGASKRGIDCSNFVSRIMNKTLNVHFPSVARNQATYFKPIKKIDSLKFGDLMFFSRSKKGQKITHVGIYINDGLFAHSSSARGGRGVVYTHISEGRYKQRFRHGGRMFKSEWS